MTSRTQFSARTAVQAAVAAMVLSASGNALADNETVAVTGATTTVFDTSPFTGSFLDVKLFTGLAAGVYNYAFNYTGFGITLFAPQTITFEGAVLPVTSSGPLSNGLVSGTLTVTNAPLTFALAGTAAPGGFYIAALNVTPVPEPETYAMLLAGLGAMGFMLRRRSRN